MKTALSTHKSNVSQLVAFAAQRTELNTGLIGMPQYFFSIPTFVATRPECEKDFNSVQIIPYTMLVDDNTGEIFTYRRGEGGGEDRLHNNISLGLGGHVDLAVPKEHSDPDYAASFIRLLVSELLRELEEEVGFMVPTPTYMTEYATVLSHVFYDHRREVDQVHIGVLSSINITDRAHLTKLEAKVIEGAKWRTIAELKTPEVFNMLEGWSKIVVEAMSSATEHSDGRTGVSQSAPIAPADEGSSLLGNVGTGAPADGVDTSRSNPFPGQC